MPKLKALVIDDESSICRSIAGILEDEGWQAIIAHSGTAGLVELNQHQPAVVFLDIWMPGMDGIETLQRIKDLSPTTPVIMMSGHGTIDTAVKVTKLGAIDFLEKPLSIDRIIALLGEQKERTKKPLPTESIHRLIGSSRFIEDLRDFIARIAPKNSAVLITGENGTGKEIVARLTHEQSMRREYPFVPVNCAAIPEDLIESELFGYSKGAFTNALAPKKGRFELAHRGTLFLDEVGDMSLRTQAKILRILQEKKFERLGEESSQEVDVRIIAATNKNLSLEMERGLFREDLFHRLNVIPVALLPLREHQEDIEPLAEHFLGILAKELQETPKKLDQRVLQALKAYAWPGNVRELKNLMERLTVTVSSPIIDLSHLPLSLVAEFEDAQKVATLTEDAKGQSLKAAKTDFERDFILEKLKQNDWNIAKTATIIGLERTHLHRKMKALGIKTDTDLEAADK